MTDTQTKPALGALFWIAGILFLLWNLIGCGLYLMDVSMSDEAYTKMYNEAMTAMRAEFPAWSTAAYAIAVWSGLLAAIMYLLRKRLAAPLFLLSLLAAIISFIWMFTNPDAQAAAGSRFWVMPLIVVAIGLFEVWYSRKKRAQGILR